MATEDSILNLRGQLPASGSGDNEGFTLGVNAMDVGQTFSSVLYYCSLILVTPIVAFFVTKVLVLEALLEFESGAVTSNVISALVAIVVLHLALALFIYKAYFEGTPSKRRLGKQE